VADTAGGKVSSVWTISVHFGPGCFCLPLLSGLSASIDSAFGTLEEDIFPTIPTPFRLAIYTLYSLFTPLSEFPVSLTLTRC